MAESALPFPTPTRVAFAGQVHAGFIRWYNFQTPQAFHTVTGRKHTADLDELVASRLASVPSCPEGESSIAELTDAGRKHFKISTEGEGPGSTSPEPGPPTAILTSGPVSELATEVHGLLGALGRRAREQRAESGHSTEDGAARG